MRISILTINLTDGSKKLHEIDYSNKLERVWLSKHTMWALNNGHSVTVCPKELADKIIIGHETEEEFDSLLAA